jgi:dienelactone hydrolase
MNRSAGAIQYFTQLVATALLIQSGFAQEPNPPAIPAPGATFAAEDTLGLDADTSKDANECLAGLRWKPGKFQVTCEKGSDERSDLLIRFPSAMPSGDAINDNVCLEWYVAKDVAKKPVRTRCVIVVHESGRGMTVGRIFARGLAAQGLHTFMVQMPGYGTRRSEHTGKPEMILTSMKQAVADARRARDAAACLPLVDGSRIGIQGTSLGGFVTSTTAGLDQGFDRVFILLAGGNLHDVVLNGAKDAAKVRERLESIGVNGDTVRELARPVEPLRLAHRLNPQTTWLYSGKYDDVVPPACSIALARAANLPDGHHIEMPADHYSGIIFLPSVMVEIRKEMLEE